jgi:ankyrin repeat protein
MDDRSKDKLIGHDESPSRARSCSNGAALKALVRSQTTTGYRMKSKNEKMADKMEGLFAQRRAKMLAHRLETMPLANATKYAIVGDELMLKYELMSGYDSNSRDPVTGRTLLHEACANGHYSIVRMLLLEYNVDANKHTILGESTALHLAVGKGYRQIVSILLGQGADVDAVDAQGCTALHLAKRLNIVKILFRHHVDPTLRNALQQTPLEAYLQSVELKDRHKDLVALMRNKEDERMIELTRSKLQDPGWARSKDSRRQH